jgi:hypothetical protein
MKKRILFAHAVVAIALVVAAACSKVENNPPVIELVNPKDGATLIVGDPVRFRCNFNDDRLLKSFRVQINSTSGADFDFDSGDIDISGQIKVSLDALTGVLYDPPVEGIEPIVIPTNLPQGSYKLTVTCVDAAGNDAKPITRNVALTAGEQP